MKQEHKDILKASALIGGGLLASALLWPKQAEAAEPNLDDILPCSTQGYGRTFTFNQESPNIYSLHFQTPDGFMEEFRFTQVLDGGLLSYGTNNRESSPLLGYDSDTSVPISDSVPGLKEYFQSRFLTAQKIGEDFGFTCKNGNYSSKELTEIFSSNNE